MNAVANQVAALLHRDQHRRYRYEAPEHVVVVAAGSHVERSLQPSLFGLIFRRLFSCRRGSFPQALWHRFQKSVESAHAGRPSLAINSYSLSTA